MKVVLKKITDFEFVCERITNCGDSAVQDLLIQTAIKCLKNRLKTAGLQINDSDAAINYFKCQLLTEEDEVFAVMFLNNKNQWLHFEKVFYGTINEALVYPRVIVKKALAVNAAAIIVGHNHPSGNSEASESDIAVTQRLQSVLKVIDVKLLDHIIVAGTEHVSFTQSGYLNQT